MKNSIKVILGVLAGIMVGSVSVVCANQAIQAMQNTEIKVSLNGQIQEFRDETTGEIQYPITYNNRTYLPLRNVASLSGLNVDYDNKTNTAVLSSYGYSDEQLIQLSRLYYTLNSSSHYNPQQVVIDSKNGDIVTIHLYDDMGDHLATSDWYTINRKTGKGTNVLEQEIDITMDGILKSVSSNKNEDVKNHNIEEYKAMLNEGVKDISAIVDINGDKIPEAIKLGSYLLEEKPFQAYSIDNNKIVPLSMNDPYMFSNVFIIYETEDGVYLYENNDDGPVQDIALYKLVINGTNIVPIQVIRHYVAIFDALQNKGNEEFYVDEMLTTKELYNKKIDELNKIKLINKNAYRDEKDVGKVDYENLWN